MNFSLIEEKRKLLRISQAEVAKRAGISHAGFQRIIYTGNTKVSTFEKISEALGVSPSFWWSEIGTEMNSSPAKTTAEELLIENIQSLKKQHEIDLNTIENLNQLINNLKHELIISAVVEKKTDNTIGFKGSKSK